MMTRNCARTFSRMVKSMLKMFQKDADVITKYRAHVAREAIDVAALGDHKLTESDGLRVAAGATTRRHSLPLSRKLKYPLRLKMM